MNPLHFVPLTKTFKAPDAFLFMAIIFGVMGCYSKSERLSAADRTDS